LLYGDIPRFEPLGRDIIGLDLKAAGQNHTRETHSSNHFAHNPTINKIAITEGSLQSDEQRNENLLHITEDHDSLQHAKLAPPVLRPNLGKAQRQYIKERADNIRAQDGYIGSHKEDLPSSNWRLVAWWNTTFGIATTPTAADVQQEINRNHPRNFDYLSYSIPASVLASRQRPAASTASIPSNQHNTTTRTLAQRITFPEQERTSNLASRITIPAGHPTSLASRITFPEKPHDKNRIQKAPRKHGAPKHN
jgi:hypothetical protein